MSRPATGTVIERRGADGAVTYALRFTAYGKRRFVTLGSEGWDRGKAKSELDNVLADVRRGIWQPPAETVVEVPAAEPTFHMFASEWLHAREQEGLAKKTTDDLHWSIELHLLPFFANLRLSEITRQVVDRYKIAKTTERTRVEELSEEDIKAMREAARERGERFQRPRGLSNASINHTISDLAQILEAAVEYGLIDSNPASGKRRLLKAAKPARPWVEPEQLPSFLASAPNQTGHLLLAILAGAGLRIGEALALRWQHVDLGTGTLHVVDAKTPKGVREVHLSPALREELALAKAEHKPQGSAFVIATSSGRKHNPSNLRRDVLAKTVETANGRLTALGIAPIGHLTFHGLRRTYASLRCICGDDVRYTADQLGHEDPRFTLRAYAQASKRRDRLAKPQREQYDLAVEWAQLAQKGRNEPVSVLAEVEAAA